MDLRFLLCVLEDRVNRVRRVAPPLPGLPLPGLRVLLAFALVQKARLVLQDPLAPQDQSVPREQLLPRVGWLRAR